MNTLLGRKGRKEAATRDALSAYAEPEALATPAASDSCVLDDAFSAGLRPDNAPWCGEATEECPTGDAAPLSQPPVLPGPVLPAAVLPAAPLWYPPGEAYAAAGVEAPEAAPPSRLLKSPMLMRMGGGVGAAAGLRGDGAAIDVARSAVHEFFK